MLSDNMCRQGVRGDSALSYWSKVLAFFDDIVHRIVSASLALRPKCNDCCRSKVSGSADST